MKQEQVNSAMAHAAARLGDDDTMHSRGPVSGDQVKRAAAKVVHAFLTELINASKAPFPTPEYFVRQALRTARGFVVKWQERGGI